MLKTLKNPWTKFSVYHTHVYSWLWSAVAFMDYAKLWQYMLITYLADVIKQVFENVRKHGMEYLKCSPLVSKRLINLGSSISASFIFRIANCSHSVKLEVLHTFWMFSMAFCTSCWHSSTKPMFNRRRALISMCSHLLIPLNLQKRHQKLPSVGLFKNAFSAVLVSMHHIEKYISDKTWNNMKNKSNSPF